MTDGVLLDSSPLYWLDEGTALRLNAVVSISIARQTGVLFASDISIWEMGTALLKKQEHRRPNLRGLAPDAWFLDVTGKQKITSLPISSAIALEAGKVPGVYLYGDPGDCFLIATARVHNLALVTRDERILDLSASNPTYLATIPC